jgi:hypothetical protein
MSPDFLQPLNTYLSFNLNITETINSLGMDIQFGHWGHNRNETITTHIYAVHHISATFITHQRFLMIFKALNCVNVIWLL